MTAPPAPTFREAFRFWLKLGFVSFGGPALQGMGSYDIFLAKLTL